MALLDLRNTHLRFSENQIRRTSVFNAFVILEKPLCYAIVALVLASVLKTRPCSSLQIHKRVLVILYGNVTKSWRFRRGGVKNNITIQIFFFYFLRILTFIALTTAKHVPSFLAARPRPNFRAAKKAKMPRACGKPYGNAWSQAKRQEKRDYNYRYVSKRSVSAGPDQFPVIWLV